MILSHVSRDWSMSTSTLLIGCTTGNGTAYRTFKRNYPECHNAFRAWTEWFPTEQMPWQRLHMFGRLRPHPPHQKWTASLASTLGRGRHNQLAVPWEGCPFFLAESIPPTPVLNSYFLFFLSPVLSASAASSSSSTSTADRLSTVPRYINYQGPEAERARAKSAK